jgi:hypothetical protein
MGKGGGVGHTASGAEPIISIAKTSTKRLLFIVMSPQKKKKGV